jgi:nitrite reductase (NO-forming)
MSERRQAMPVRDGGGKVRRCVSPWPMTALSVIFGLIWAIDAVLKWLPGFRSAYMSTIMGIAAGQPGWLKPWFRFWIDLQHPRAVFFAYVVAVLETLIAIALVLGLARKLTYAAAAVFSVLIWATAEGFGGPYTTGSSDIGTAVIYAVVFMGLLALSYYSGPSPYTLDYYLEKRFSWWWHLAEVRRPERPVAVIGSTLPVSPMLVSPLDSSPKAHHPA